jgi:hypothetical protein
VRYHNIVGRVAKRGLLGRVTGDGDGVVSYTSAHLDEAASEITVEADHLKIHRHPRAVLEVQRVLRAHLAELESPAPRQLERLPWTTSNGGNEVRPAAYPGLQAAGPPLP